MITRLKLFGDSECVEKFWKNVLLANYITDCSVMEITVSVGGHDFCIIRTDDNCDGTILVYDYASRKTWDDAINAKTVMPGVVVIAGWHKAEFVPIKSGTLDGFSLVPVTAPFTDIRTLDIPHFGMCMCEDVWFPIQYITERVHCCTTANMSDVLSDIYWGE